MGKEILKQLGRLGNFILHRGRHAQSSSAFMKRDIKNSEDMIDYIRETCRDVAESSLIFLTGAGWQSFVALKSFAHMNVSRILLPKRKSIDLSDMDWENFE